MDTRTLLMLAADESRNLGSMKSEWNGPSLAESTRIMACHEWKQAHWFFISANIFNIVSVGEPIFPSLYETVENSVISVYWCDWKAHFGQHTFTSKLLQMKMSTLHCSITHPHKFRYVPSMELDLSEIYISRDFERASFRNGQISTLVEGKHKRKKNAQLNARISTYNVRHFQMPLARFAISHYRVMSVWTGFFLCRSWTWTFTTTSNLVCTFNYIQQSQR